MLLNEHVFFLSRVLFARGVQPAAVAVAFGVTRAHLAFVGGGGGDVLVLYIREHNKNTRAYYYYTHTHTYISVY